MSFEVGRLSAALTLDGVSEFHREMDGVGRKFEEAGQKGSAFGRAGETAVRAAAGATTGLVTAAGAYLAILTKTGVSYNSLQQNSRAALKVMLGGAEAANAQMSQLDDFARNSPFSKSVFISAQQQLLGFGVEAAKVIPTLDAIQQTVASFGGNADQITSITDVLARIQSQGKLGGEALERLGYYGVDAAKIIGEQMGLTAAEIKEMAGKPGGIPVEQIWDPLVNGLQQNFGGAADGIKEQWSGAVDRIKAANRDLGAHIAEPFVSADGGGMAVTWGNQVADVLRAIEKQAIPVMSILTQRGMPFFASLTEGLDKARMSIQRWDASTLEQSLDKLGNHAPGVAALAGATLALGAQVGPLGTMLKALGISANPVVAALVGMAAASPEVRESLKGVLEAGKPLVPVVGELAKTLSGTLNAALPVVASGVDVFAAALKVVVGIVEKIPAPVLVGVAAFLSLNRAVGLMKAPLTAVSTALLQFGQRAQIQAALGGTNAAIGGLSVASMGATGAVKGLGVALKTAFISNPIGIALTAVSMAIGAWAMANAEAQQRVQEHQARVAELRGTLNETTGALTSATTAALAQVASTGEMAEHLRAVGTSGQAFVTALSLGGEAAKVFEERVVKSAKSTEEYDKYSGNWKVTADKLGVSLDTLVRSSLGFTDAQQAVDSALQKSGGSFTSLQSDLDNTTRGIQSHLSSQYAVVSSYEDQRQAVEDAQETQRRMNDAARDTAASMTDSARSNQRFNDALSVARDTTQDAETRLRALKQALDELKGGTISAEQAQINLTRTAESLAEGLSRTDDAGNKLWQSTLDGAGKISTATGAGADFAEQMRRAGDGMLDAARAASDKALADGDLTGAIRLASEAGEQHIARLQEEMRQAGLTEEQIAGLTKEYFSVPELVATLLTDNGSISEVDQKTLGVIARLGQVPEGKTVTIDNPGGQETIDRLRDLGYKVEAVPGTKQITVTQIGADETARAIDAVANTRRVAYIEVQSTGDLVVPGAGGRLTKADGGVVSHTGGQTRDMKSFANGGFTTGIYAGGPPIIKFAEPETGWEAFISGRKGQEQRNAKIAMDALNRLGFPVVPASALRGIPEFANGGTIGTPAPSRTAPAAPVRVDRGRSAPLVGTVNIGNNTAKSDLAELRRQLDFYERGSR